MAENSQSNDFWAHQETYNSFMLLTKRAIVFIAFVVFALFNFIVSGITWLGWAFLILSVPAALFFIRRN